MNRTVLQTCMPDQPFIVDTMKLYTTQCGVRVVNQLNVVLPTTFDEDHQLIAVGGNTADTRHTSYTRWYVTWQDATDEALVRELATGQIYTAGQALGHGLVDEIGYEDNAIESLKDQLKLESVHVVTYRVRPGWIDLLLDYVESRDPERQLAKWLEAGVPRGMYLSSWGALPPSLLE